MVCRTGWNPKAIMLDRDAINGPLSQEQPTNIAWFLFDPAGPDPKVRVKGQLPVNPTFGDDSLQVGLGVLRSGLRDRVKELLEAAQSRFFAGGE